jgi:HEAT repeat protein
VTEDPTTSGREPSLSSDSDTTGREPFIGGESSLTSILLELQAGEGEPTSDAIIMRLAGALPQLLALLHGGDSRDRYIAARTIGMLAATHPQSRPQTVPVLIELLESSLESGVIESRQMEMFELAVDRLGDTADPTAAEALTRVLLSDRRYFVTQRSIASLTRLGAVALPSLMATVEEETRSVYYLVLRAIGRICRADPATIPQVTDWITPLVLNQQLLLEYRVAQLLAQLRPDHLIEQLLAVAADPDRDRDFRVRVVGAFAYIRGPRVAESMLELLVGDERFLRRRAALALCNNRRREDISTLIELMRHDDPQVRRYATLVASRRRIRTAVPTYLELLNDSRAEVRREAVIALRRVRVSQAIPALVGMITDRANPVRRELVTALRMYQYTFPDHREEIDAALEVALDDRDARVRGIASAALRS